MIMLALDIKIKSDEAINSIISWPKKGEIRIEKDNSRYAVIIEWLEFNILNPKILFLGKIFFICFLRLVVHILFQSIYLWLK